MTALPPWRPTGSSAGPRIADVTAVVTAPDGICLVVVKVQTTEPELYGLGCATFTQYPAPPGRPTVVQEYLRPFLAGRDPADIEDIWHAVNLSGYWRSGPVLNNALCGVDQALWDLKGKLAGMPVYQLFVNPAEYLPLVRDRLIDFIRVHVSAPGRSSPAALRSTTVPCTRERAMPPVWAMASRWW